MGHQPQAPAADGGLDDMFGGDVADVSAPSAVTNGTSIVDDDMFGGGLMGDRLQECIENNTHVASSISEQHSRLCLSDARECALHCLQLTG